ncbi:Katanin p80 WD40 repeat-containing subunit B1 [Trichoplax sp. H2]|nr:Katanin p80 WD40 repeat-containing subunit B1 [Trichoplax sp. H2]|eukprot:RDD47138.1 Katanin p80 WD40 repeat-containing subunit B1 [Trichoplax sp. H2]
MAAQSQSSKRAWKLEEFVAHTSSVNCLSLGSKSGRVMVTGGEDNKVNMWAIGKPNVIMSLSGHTSPVECVKFNPTEELVMAGSKSGTLKIWDLDSAKIVRTLTGHKSNIQSLNFHPYGDFVASGSLDTNVKLWDIRRKGCIFTYKGHTDGITAIEFSPDGRWIVSSSADSSARLWDLTAGKILHSFSHNGPVNTIEFHPNEFLLATGSSDRTVKFWDLETFQLVSSTEQESSAIRRIKFSEDGSVIFSGLQDVLKVYNWEPIRCYDTVQVGWEKIVDFTVASNQLIGASFNQANVSVSIIDIEKLNMTGSSGQHMGITQDHTAKVDIASKPPEYMKRPATTSTKPSKLETSEIPNSEKAPTSQRQSLTDMGEVERLSSPGYQDAFTSRPKIPRDSNPKDIPVDPFKTEVGAVGDTKQSKSNEKCEVENLSEKTTDADDLQSCQNNKRVSSAISSEAVSVTLKEKAPEIDLSLFPTEKTDSKIDENKILLELLKDHSVICSVIGNRIQNLNAIHEPWMNGNIKDSIDKAIQIQDTAVLVDLLNILIRNHKLWTLDICAYTLPQVKTLIQDKRECYIRVACQVLRLILKNFGSLIKSTLRSTDFVTGVDITREERLEKCRICYEELSNIKTVISEKAMISGKIGGTFRELQLAFATAID